METSLSNIVLQINIFIIYSFFYIKESSETTSSLPEEYFSRSGMHCCYQLVEF